MAILGMSNERASSVRSGSTYWRPVATSLRSVAFWAGIVLPVVFVPLLYGGVGGRQLLLFFGLVALNVVCLVLGHGHSPRKAA